MDEHFFELLVDFGRLVGASSSKLDSLVHHLQLNRFPVDDASGDPLRSPVDPAHLSRGLSSAHDSARTVDGGVEGVLRLGGVDSFENHAIVTHGRPNEALLARKRRRAALSDHPKLLSKMLLLPSEVM